MEIEAIWRGFELHWTMGFFLLAVVIGNIFIQDSFKK